MNLYTSNRNSKLTALAILIFLLYCLWLLVAKPYLALWQDKFSDVEILQKKYATLSRLVKNKSNFEQQYQKINNNQALQELFLNNKSGALADVKLQRIVKQIIVSSDGKPIQVLIQNSQFRTKKNQPSEVQDDKAVTVKVLMQGSMKAIYSTLHKLENSRPLILVSDLEVSQNIARYQITQRGGTDYRARYDVTAFIL